MNSSTLIAVVMVFALLSYWIGIQRAVQVAGGKSQAKRLSALPSQFGLLTAFYCGIPALVSLVLWSLFEPAVIESLLVSQMPAHVQQMNDQQLGLYLNSIQVLANNVDYASIGADKLQEVERLEQLTQNSAWLKTLLVLICSVSGSMLIMRKFSVTFKARQRAERIVQRFLMASSAVAVFTTLGIVLSVLVESVTFFSQVPLSELLFGTHWSPQTAMRAEQVASSGAFGAVPLFAGTLLITFIAMLIAVPVGLMTAIYLSNYASAKLRAIAKPMLELLAGIPTVVYGFFAALTVAPFIRNVGEGIGLNVASQSALAAGIVMGIMIIPFVSSLSDDALNAVPYSLKEGSLGMGATLSETIKLVLLPAALPGIVGAILLAISRAIGETMIVVMAAGLAANLTINPLESVTTVTVQMVTLLTGDQEFDSPKTLAAFALGLMLFLTTLALNVFALKVVRKYREQYE